jgi:CubicO group peptidase (beta-lactamase class C family)
MLGANKQYFLKIMDDAHIPALSAATVIDGKCSDDQVVTLGITDAIAKTPVTSETIFEAASLSKPVFAYFILKLVELGKLSRPGESADSGLDRPLYELADFGPPQLRTHPYYQLLNARMILSHQSGLPNVAPIEFLFKPGEQYRYSGLAYSYLQQVIEQHLGLPLEKLTKLYVFTPLEMNHSSFCRPDNATIAARHDENMIPQPLTAEQKKPVAVSANSLHTTASDYARFIAWWLNDKKLPDAFDVKRAVSMTKDQWAEAQKIAKEDLQKLFWGLGWGLLKTNQGIIAYHWGDMGDCKAFAAINLTTRTAIVYFANSQNGLAIAPDITATTVQGLDPAFRYLFTKFGFTSHTESGWEDKQKRQSWHNFATYEIHNKPGWFADLQTQKLLTIDSVKNDEEKCTLTITCDPKLAFVKIIKNELDIFKYNNKLDNIVCIAKPETASQDITPALTITIPNRLRYHQFIAKLNAAQLLPRQIKEEAAQAQQVNTELNRSSSPTPLSTQLTPPGKKK